jgi:hypothetical protein
MGSILKQACIILGRGSQWGGIIGGVNGGECQCGVEVRLVARAAKRDAMSRMKDTDPQGMYYNDRA